MLLSDWKLFPLIRLLASSIGEEKSFTKFQKKLLCLTFASMLESLALQTLCIYLAPMMSNAVRAADCGLQRRLNDE